MGWLKNLIKGTQNHTVINQTFSDNPTTKYAWEDASYNAASSKYFSGMEKLEADWSVMYNLKDYSGARADKLIRNCKRNIQDFELWVDIGKKYKEESPPNVPAYKRLAMIYEKQGLYNDAANVCMYALSCGAHNDGSKGGMKGRLARMIKKDGRTPTPKEMEF